MALPNAMRIYVSKPYLIGGGIIVLLAAAYLTTLGPRAPVEAFVTAKKGDVMQEVFLTGTVAAAQRASLSFDRGGVITSLPRPVGANVAVGDVLASLRNEAEAASVAEEEALLAIAEAKLAQARKGAREEELKLKEAEMRKAEVAVQSIANKTRIALVEAYSAAEESLSRYADPFFQSDNTDTPRLTYSTGTQDAYRAEAKRLEAGRSVRSLQALLDESADAEEALAEALRNLRMVQNLFVTLGVTLQDGVPLDAATLADYRSRVTNARSALAAAVTAVQNQMNAGSEAAAEFLRARRAHELTSAGATPETIREAEQTVAQERAGLRGAQAALEKTLLRAPFTGQIASRQVELGETVTSATVVMELLGSGGFVIEANVPEADSAKIAEHDAARVTLDAYGDGVTFAARVSEIERSERVIEGVSTYKTTFVFDADNARLRSAGPAPVRSGMTANVTIVKTLKTGALLIPAHAVRSNDGRSFVLRHRPDGVNERKMVILGARNGTREVEVAEGLSEGDRILLPEIR